ncbi:MAG TPA: hypothetical protein VMF59_01980, partial [Bacteroidota bacterium]|nr:hypothetical protein [Bacteroidota bacterium]
MRTCQLFCTLALLAVPASLPAQDSLRPLPRDILKEIIAYRETDAGVIAKARSLILDCVRTGDTAKGRPVLSYLEDHYRGTRYVPLWPSEQLLLRFWASDFQAILDPLSLDARDTMRYQAFVTPPKDMLLEDLRDALNPRRSQLRAAVLGSSFHEDESAFLEILLASLLGDGRDPESQKTLNEESDDFLSRFGDSRYAPFVRRNIRFVLQESRVGWGLTLGAGSGSVNSNLGSLFSCSGVFGIGGDIGIRRMIGGLDAVFYLRLSASLDGKVRSAFNYNGEWEAGAKQQI